MAHTFPRSSASHLGTGEMPFRQGKAATSDEDYAEARVVRLDNKFAIEWPSNGSRVHKVARSSNPADFTGAPQTVVKGARWVDTWPDEGDSPVQFYLID